MGTREQLQALASAGQLAIKVFARCFDEKQKFANLQLGLNSEARWSELPPRTSGISGARRLSSAISSLASSSSSALDTARATARVLGVVVLQHFSFPHFSDSY